MYQYLPKLTRNYFGLISSGIFAICLLAITAFSQTKQTIISATAGAEAVGLEANKSFDGITTSRWNNNVNNNLSTAWITYDIGTSKALTSVSLMMYSGTNRTYPISIQVGNTNPPTQTVYTGNTQQTASMFSIPITATGRYIKIALTANNSSANTYFSIYETEIYGGGGGTTYTLSTAISPTAAGTISLNPTGGSYSSGTVVNATATPASGYQFSNWTGSVSGTANPISITMNSNSSITANFTSITTGASKWYTGAGAPSSSLGSNGDYYLNTANADVYAKNGGLWAFSTNIRGLQGINGAQGPQGVQGIQGAIGPQGPVGPKGAFPNGNATGDMQYWNGSAWVMIPAGQHNQILTENASRIPTWKNAPKGHVTDIDGNVYQTVVIGNQEWTITNLRTTHFMDGTYIYNKASDYDWVNSADPAYCYYLNTTDPDEQEKWGALYNGFAVYSYHNLAPEGWRIPSNDDWIVLDNYLIANGYNYDGTTNGYKTGKSYAIGLWQYSGVNGAIGKDLNFNNRNGFSALPTGQRDNSGFSAQGQTAYFFSSTEVDANNSRYRLLGYNNEYIAWSYQSKYNGYSVRLVRDLN